MENLFMEYVISKGYKIAKAYSTEVVEVHESITINASPVEASLLSRILGEKVKIIVWLDALSLGIRPAEELEPLTNVTKAQLAGIKDEVSESDSISEENLTEIVGQFLVTETYLTMLEEDLAHYN